MATAPEEFPLPPRNPVAWGEGDAPSAFGDAVGDPAAEADGAQALGAARQPPAPPAAVTSWTTEQEPPAALMQSAPWSDDQDVPSALAPSAGTARPGESTDAAYATNDVPGRTAGGWARGDAPSALASTGPAADGWDDVDVPSAFADSPPAAAAWGEEDAPSAFADPEPRPWAREDAPSALASAPGWGSQDDVPSAFADPEPRPWAREDAPSALDPDAGTAAQAFSAPPAAAAWGEGDAPSAFADPEPRPWGREDAPSALASAPGWGSQDDVPSAFDDAPPAVAAWGEGDAPSAFAEPERHPWAREDAPSALGPDAGTTDQTSSAPLAAPDIASGRSTADEVPRVLPPVHRPPSGSEHPNLPAQDRPTGTRTAAAQTNGREAARTPRTTARSARSTSGQGPDADARGDPDVTTPSTEPLPAGNDTRERNTPGTHPAPADFAAAGTLPQEGAKGETPHALGKPPQRLSTAGSNETPSAFDAELDEQGTTPKQQADAHQTQHTPPVPTGSGENSDVPSAPGQGPEELGQEGYIAALMDVADQAFQYADEAANRAQRAAARASTRNEERLEAVMHAAHAHWLAAEHHHDGAREAHADGQKSRLEYYASEVISAAVETQRAAGVATTADALREVLEGLKPATERARQAELREQLQAELDRELTAVTRMDAANRDRLLSAQWRAESAVPELGWWPALAADMAHAHQGRLWLDETGTPRLVKWTDDGGVVAGRKVDAARVAMLRAAGFLVTGTEGETSRPLRPSDMGREALYLATLYPEGLHEDARAAYEARYEQSRRSWMNSEERKSAARRLPPLDRHAMRAVREKPVLLEEDQIPQISTEAATRHAEKAELAQRFGRWAAMSHSERPDLIQALGTAEPAQEREALAGETSHHDVIGDEGADAAPAGELPGRNTPLAGIPSSPTTPDEASERTSGSPAADVAPAQPLAQEREKHIEPEDRSADTSSTVAAASLEASGGNDEVPAVPLASPGVRNDPATDIRQPSVQEQTELFSAPTPAQDVTAATEATVAEPEEELPRYSQARQQILDEIARGNISEVDGRFMQRVPRRSVRPFGSPQRINAVLDEELAERAGKQILLSERGLAWYAHHNRPLPAVPRDVATVEQAPLPPIDYAPLHPFLAWEESGEAPLPPAPAPLPHDWYKTEESRSEENIQGAYAMGAEAAERAARSTARDVASIAAGPDHSFWTHQHPLAQYDENAAAALESLTDPLTRAYAARAVRNLRGALEEAGKEATDHYVQNVRSAQWKTAEGSQSDDVYRERVRGIVITYARAVREHATAYGFDADSIVHVLEDAAGWTGRFRPLGNKAVEYPYLPAAENVAGAAQHLANALRLYALGRSETVDTAADRRKTWRTVEPRRPIAAPTAPDPEAPPARPAQEAVGVPDATSAAMPTFPRLSQARRRALVDIARGNITEVDGLFMKRTSEHTVERAYSQHAVTDVLGLGLAERAGQQIRITEYGTAWLAHHKITVTDGSRQNAAAPGETVLPPISSDPPATLPVAGAAMGSPQPPALASEHASTEAPGREDAETAQAPPSPHSAEDAATDTTPSAGDLAIGSTRTDPTDQQEAAQSFPTQGPLSPDETALAQPTTPRPGQGPPEGATGTPIAADAAVDFATPDGPASSLAATAERTPALPDAAPRTPAQGGDPGVLAETAPDPADHEKEPGAPGLELNVPAQEMAAAGPGDRWVPPSPGPTDTTRPPAAVPEEGTVATSAPPSAAAVAIAPDQAAISNRQLELESPAPYPDADAYATAHEALLTELDQHEQWLALTPAAAEAAAILADTGDLGIPGLAALLALQAALGEGPDEDGQHTPLAQRLGHHIRCAQMTMAKIYFVRAARTSSTDLLRDLYEWAAEGQFLALSQRTADGELELGQYLPMRAQQITQQSVGAGDPAEPTPQTTQEATTVAVDPDDDSELPVFELPGEVIMSAAEAAPRLLAQAQAHLAAGNPAVSVLAHLHGRPVYARADQEQPSAPVLMLGLTAVDEEGSARPVTIPGHELAAVAPETLLTAVTEWMNASDAGYRPLLHSAPAVPAPAPAHQAPDQATQAEAEQPAPATTPTAPEPAPPSPDPYNPQASTELPASTAPSTTAAPEPARATPAATATPAVSEIPTAPTPGSGQEQTAPSASARSTVPEDDARSLPGGEEHKAQHSTRQAETTPATPATLPATARTEPVDQLTELARSALTDLGVTLEATGVVTADLTVVITVETSGDAERDREITDQLRPALHEAIRQHPDRGLAAYRVDFQHTPQVGQSALHDAAAGQGAAVPRERLIAANRAAAQIFTERLQTDPNAELARTYLTEERRLPLEVQREWGLGYAPSDRGAGRWDVLVTELTAQGFTEEELLHAGLATRSKRDTLIDALADRIIFPIHDENGDIVGFSGRSIDRPGETEEQAKKRGGPKYFNTSNDADLFNKGDLVFGLHHPAQSQVLAQSSGPRVSVEGYLDVIAVARAAATVPIEQRPVVGAPMGTAFTERQLTALRGLDTDNPRPHIAFLDADESGRKVLLDKWDLLVKAAGPTTVTTAPDAKDAAKLWEEGIEADGDGAAPVLRALEQRQPLLDATVEAVLLKNADDGERASHSFASGTFFPRTRFIAAEAARYIHQAVQIQAPGDTTALQQAALTWAKRLHRAWGIPGHMTATAVLLGPGTHDEDYENEVYEQALDLLAADPEGYFADDSHVRSRQSASAALSSMASGTDAATARPGQWPAGTRASGSATSTSGLVNEPAPGSGELVLSMFLPSPVDGQLVEHADRTTAAYALHTAVHERLGQHTTESPEPDRLPQPLKLGTVYGIDLSTSGDDQTSEDPTVVVWLGSARTDSLRMSYSRFVEMTGPELLAAVEWRAAQAAGLLGAPLSQTWRNAVRSVLPSQFPARPTSAQLADLLDTIAQGPDGSEERTRRRAEQALALYTAGHPDLALNILAADDHIWVLRNDGSWIQEAAVGTELSWDDLDNGFSQEAAELDDIAQAATALPPGDPVPMPADLTVAHHSAHEALAALRPYSIGLPNTRYEKITDLVAQMDATEPTLRRLHGPGGERLMNRAKGAFIRIIEGLATVASKIRLTALSNRLESTVARLRGQAPDTQPVPRAVRTDRRIQDLAHIERDLERRMAAPTTTLDERGELQEQWIINRARWRARYEQLQGQPPGSDFLPDNGLIAGAPPIPNLIAAHDLLLNRLSARVEELRDTDPHTGEESNPYDPTADLFNGVAWAYQQRLVGIVPTGDDPQGPIDPAQLRQAALAVTSHQNASPLTLRRTMNVTAERADRLLHRLEEQQILGPYRADAPRTVLARPTDIDTLLARPATPPSLRTPPAEPAPAQTPAGPEPDGVESEGADTNGIDEARIYKMVLKILADQQKRSETRGEPHPAEAAAPASRVRKNLRNTTHKEAEANALAAGQSTSLAPSQP
ncbi:toprim domain-containing protein [Streptomyces sp. NPDC052415]|uniref:toprim domain-containing protein n=1 Tax=Streptomyces sp. NPDC052415 TaxID=3365690 RepID=UPI0037D6E837